MLALERHREILALLDQDGSVRVAELARQFDVTEETIRRDLDKLEAAGKLVRSHGGAMMPEPDKETPFWRRETSRQKEKIALAAAAVEKIQPGERLILDSSTTVLELARRLPNMPLTVITNSVYVVLTLSSLDKIELMGLGGRFSARSFSFLGPTTEEQLSRFHADRLFFSCEGLDVERGRMTDPTEALAHLKQLMLGCADRAYLLLDHSKFGVNSLAGIGGLDGIEEIITDGQTPPVFLKTLRQQGWPVRVAQEGGR